MRSAHNVMLGASHPYMVMCLAAHRCALQGFPLCSEAGIVFLHCFYPLPLALKDLPAF